MSDHGQPLSRASRRPPPIGNHRLARENEGAFTSGQPLSREIPTGQPLATERGTPLAKDHSQAGQPLLSEAPRGRPSADGEAPLSRGQALARDSVGGQPLQMETRRGQGLARDLTRELSNRQALMRDGQRGHGLTPSSAGQALQRKGPQRQTITAVSGRSDVANGPPSLQRASMGQAISREPQRAQASYFQPLLSNSEGRGALCRHCNPLILAMQPSASSAQSPFGSKVAVLCK